MKKKAICLILSLLTVFSCMACRGESEKIDETKTQLYIFNYNAGFGNDWLNTAIKRFEAKYADVSFEEGKTGVQVWPDNQISMPDNNTIKGQNNAIYFLEEKDYYEGISQGVYKDITAWLQEPLTAFGETESIEEKMVAYGNTFPDFYKTSEGKYYAIPFHEGFWGINYDVDCFATYKLFMSASFDATQSDVVSNDTYWTNGQDKSNLSKGPDDKAGTLDDGLPATYDDFYVLLDRMLFKGVTPFHWSGVNRRYTTNMMFNLWVDYEGEEQMMLNYRMDGTEATDLVASVDGSGKPVLDETPLAITQANGYELQRQAGKYYALRFAEKILSNKRYYHENAYSPSETHLTAQSTYLYSELNGDPIAFLIDGSYWQREANPVFTEMGNSIDESYSRANRNFGMLPFPKATEEKLGEKQTIAGGAGSFVAVNNSSSAKVTKQMELAKLFIQYIHTDEILKVFTENTGATRPLDYDFTDEEMAAQPYYTQTIWNLHKNNKIICPWSHADVVITNHDEFNDQNSGFTVSSVDATPFDYLKNISAREAFGRLYNYKKNKWPQLF